MTGQDKATARGTVPAVGTELVNPVAGSRTVFRATSVSTDGAYVEVEQTYRPDWPKPPLHVHPHQDEDVTVVQGNVHAVVGEHEHDLYPGDLLHIPRGTPHRMWGGADVPTIVVRRTTPALRTDELYCELWVAAAEAHFRPDPMRAHEVALRFTEELQLCSPR